MATVTIHRADRVPDCCIVCGAADVRRLRLKFSLYRGDTTIFNARSLSRLLRSAFSTLLSIEWSLPFCQRHVRKPAFRQNMQSWMVLNGYGVLALGIWSLFGTRLTWPFIASLFAAPLLIAFAQHGDLRPRRVTRHALELGAVHETFAAELDACNQIETPVADES